MLVLSAVDHGFQSWSGQTKDSNIGICGFFAKNAALRRKSKNWLAWNEDNVSGWDKIYIRLMLFQCVSTKKNPAKHVGLEQSGLHHWKLFCSYHYIAEKLLSWCQATIVCVCWCSFWNFIYYVNRFYILFHEKGV